MDEQQVQELDPATYAILLATKLGTAAEARIEFLDAATERFGFIPLPELERIWSEATAAAKKEG